MHGSQKTCVLCNRVFFSKPRHCYMVKMFCLYTLCVQIVQHMQQMQDSSLNLSLKDNKLTAKFPSKAEGNHSMLYDNPNNILYIYIFSDKRESYIKDTIIHTVICIVLPLVYISVVLCKDKGIVFPQNRYICLQQVSLLTFAKEKGKVYSNGNPV